MAKKGSLLAGIALAGILGMQTADSYASRPRRTRAGARPARPSLMLTDERVEYTFRGFSVQAQAGDEIWRYAVRPHCDGRHLEEVAAVTAGGTTTSIHNALPQDDGIDQVVIERPGTRTTIVRDMERQWSVREGSVDDVASLVAHEQERMDRMRRALRIGERSRDVPERARYPALRDALTAVPSPEHFSTQDGISVATAGDRQFSFRYVADQSPVLTISDAQGEMMRVAGGNSYLRVFTQGAWMGMSYIHGLPMARPPHVCHDQERFIRFDVWDLMNLAHGTVHSMMSYFPAPQRR